MESEKKVLDREQLDLIKDQLKGYLKTYLQQFVTVTDSGYFKCIHPDHEDKHPSASIDPNSNWTRWRCWSCGVSGDIFTAAHWLEGKPASGPGWFTDTFKYLCSRFGIDMSCLPEPSDSAKLEMSTARAYYDAYRIIIEDLKDDSELPDAAKEKLAEYGWSSEVRRSLGIGATDHEKFIQKMLAAGHDREFLKKIDLDNWRIFGAHTLVYTIKDEAGNPVAFAARDLKLEERTKKWEARYNEALQNYGEGSAEADKLWAQKPTKFVNNSSSNSIYQKNRRLFGFHVAKHFKHLPLYVFEGYSDVATAHHFGLKNSVALGSTAWNDNHFDLVLGCGFDHIIFVLDADAAGERGTEQFIQRIESRLRDHTLLRVELIRLPEGSDDPDKLLRSQGIEAFKSLPKMDIFSWKIRKALDSGVDQMVLAERVAVQISEEHNSLQRWDQAEKFCQQSGIDLHVFWSRVLQIIETRESELRHSKDEVARQIANLLMRSGTDAEYILREGIRQMETVTQTTRAANTDDILKYIQGLIKLARSRKELTGLKTGFPIFDKKFGGIPEIPSFITVPGKPNQGKSSFLANLAWRILDYNKQAVVIYHTIDDSMESYYPRLLGSKYNIFSHYYERLGYYSQFDAMQEYHEKYIESIHWLESMIKDGRFHPMDVSQLRAELPALETKIEQVRREFPDAPLVVFGDNFHLYDRPGSQDGESKTRQISMYAKTLANQYRATLIMTMELPKNALAPGMRPRMINIKGSSGMSYDASANIGVYNDMKDFREQAVLTWKDPDNIEFDDDTKLLVNRSDVVKPVIELVFDKSKVSRGFDGDIYFHMKPESGRYEECAEELQKHYAEIAIAQKEQILQQKAPVKKKVMVDVIGGEFKSVTTASGQNSAVQAQVSLPEVLPGQDEMSTDQTKWESTNEKHSAAQAA